LAATDDLDKGNQVGRIERMPDDTALGVQAAVRLNLAHGEARRARSNYHVGGQQLVELAVELLLEVDPLGSVFLDQVRACHGGRQVASEGQMRLRRAGR